jgi:hypothetical protein
MLSNRHLPRRPLVFYAAAVLLAASSVRLDAQDVTVFADTFAGGNVKGWTIGTEWGIGAATSSPGGPLCGLGGDPGSDSNNVPGGMLAGVVIGGSPSNGVHGWYYLESPVIPLAPGETSSILYTRWLNNLNNMNVVVEAFDGAAWQSLYFIGGCIAESSWSQWGHDVTPYANPNFRVRFGFQVVANFGSTGASWNIDDVMVTTKPEERICNGSFETTFPPAPSMLIGTTSTAGSGWQVVSGNYEAFSSFWPASHGVNSIDLCGLVAGTISTKARLYPNRDYQIAFDLGANYNGPSTSSMQLTILFDAASGLSPVSAVFSASNAGNSSTFMNWLAKSLRFDTVGAATPTVSATFTLASVTTGPSGNAVDNVRLIKADTIVNGSFELAWVPTTPPILALPQRSAFLHGWSIPVGSVDLVGVVQAADGVRSVGVCGNDVGTLEQTLLLRKNRSYRLDLDGAVEGFLAPATLQLTLTFDDPGLAATTAQYAFQPGTSITNMGWSGRTFIFQTTGAANDLFAAKLSFTAVAPPATYAGPMIDHVRLSVTDGAGQPNTTSASLTVNGVGALGVNGPWLEGVTDASGINLAWQGPANVPFALLLSFVDGFHTSFGTWGSLDLGNPAAGLGDIIVLIDGLSFPGAFFYALNAGGSATTAFSATTIPVGTEFAIQGFVVQPGGPAPLVFTAAHRLLKL